ncbi:hypothetical protein BKI52_35500 [marine bacterium AO1-C]|nr:hypothetical protein BKI52_35500 [marine bacterium AO1-C]
MSNSEANKEIEKEGTESPSTPANNASNQLKQLVAQSDEIDLRALWEQFVSFLRKVIKITIKRGIVLLVFLAIGGGWGYYRHQVSAPVYKTRMLIDTKIADYSILSGLIGTLQKLADEGNAPALASTLNIKNDIAKSIVAIKAVDKLVVYKDLSEQENRQIDKYTRKEQQSAKERDKEIFQLKNQKFAIEVALFNNNNFPILEKSLLMYLRQNDYLKQKIALKKVFLEKKKKKIQKEVSDLDSLKKNIAEIFTRKNQNIQITDPGTITQLYEKAVKLKEDELKIDTTLAMLDNVQVVESFVKFNQPTVKVTKRIKTGLYIGFALWFMLVLWLDVRKPFLKFLEGDKKQA